MTDQISIGLPAMQLVCHLVVLGNITDSVPAVTELPTQNETGYQLPNGYTVFTDIGFAYKYHDQNLTWIQARNLCQQEGTQLAVIDTTEKVEVLKAWILPRVYMRIGIIRMEGTTWANVNTGLNVTSLPWQQGSYPRATGDCVDFHPGNSGITNINTCGTQLPYLCELPIYQNSTVVAN